jgi:hypothetical protein
VDKHCSKHAVPEGVELMLTKASEEELEHGLAIAPPPHEARSRSGGSWGSSKQEANSAAPKAVEATPARAKPCSSRKPATAPSATGADMAGLGGNPRAPGVKLAAAQPAPPVPFEAKRSRSKADWSADDEAAAMRGTLGEEAAGGTGTGSNGRRARRPRNNSSRASERVSSSGLWVLGPAAPDETGGRPSRRRPRGSGGGAGRRCRVAMRWVVGEVGGVESDVECRHYCRSLPRGPAAYLDAVLLALCFAGEVGG